MRQVHTSTRIFRGLAWLATAVVLSAPLAQAQSWPAKTLRFVNAFPAGGPSDILARAVGEAMQASVGQAAVVDNKPGAGGNLASAEVARAAADGHTWLWTIDTAFTVNPHIYPNLGFRLADLKPLVIISSNGLMLGAHAGRAYKNLGDMVAQGKGKGLNFSSGGSGSPGHLAAEVFTDAAGVKVTHVPYKGNSPAVMAIVSGEVDGGILSISGLLPQVKAGKVTALAVTSSTRSKLAPDVPTVGELGFKGLESEVVSIVMVPSNTPDAVVAAMQKAVLEALTKPEVQARIGNLDMRYEGLTGAAAVKRLGDLHERYGKVIKATGMKVE